MVLCMVLFRIGLWHQRVGAALHVGRNDGWGFNPACVSILGLSAGVNRLCRSEGCRKTGQVVPGLRPFPCLELPGRLQVADGVAPHARELPLHHAGIPFGRRCKAAAHEFLVQNSTFAHACATTATGMVESALLALPCQNVP